MNGFYQTFYDILATIEDSINKQRIVPALILIYSGIDGISSLNNPGGGSSRTTFKDWTKKWMLEKYPLPCDENDIYSARCGLLHQQISVSDLTIGNKAKQIFYTWGNADIRLLEKAIKIKSDNGEVVAVKVEDLLYSFRMGIADNISGIENDEALRKVFEDNSKRVFVSFLHPIG